MSRFHGTLAGDSGREKILSSLRSLETVAASDNGAVVVHLYANLIGEEWVNIAFEPWNDIGRSQVIYDGPLCGDADSDGLSAIRCRTCVNGSNWAAANKELAKRSIIYDT